MKNCRVSTSKSREHSDLEDPNFWLGQCRQGEFQTPVSGVVFFFYPARLLMTRQMLFIFVCALDVVYVFFVLIFNVGAINVLAMF